MTDKDYLVFSWDQLRQNISVVDSARLSLMRCLFYGLLLLLTFCFFTLTSFIHAAQALEVKGHTMALGINSDGMPLGQGTIYPRGGYYKAEFWTEDKEAYVWMNITLDKGTTIVAQWRFPNSSLYQTKEKTVNTGSQMVWFSINIKDAPPMRVPGMWKVDVSAENNLLFTEEFAIAQAPTYPWETTLKLTGAVAVMIAAPLLLIFATMKNQPPKLGFALSLIGGLTIAVSGFFRGALGGELYIISGAMSLAILIFGILAGTILGAVISLSALTRRWMIVIILSVFSLVYFVWIYSVWMSEDPRLYVLPLVLVIVGSVCSILGGLLTRRKALRNRL